MKKLIEKKTKVETIICDVCNDNNKEVEANHKCEICGRDICDDCVRHLSYLEDSTGYIEYVCSYCKDILNVHQKEINNIREQYLENIDGLISKIAYQSVKKEQNDES